MEESHGGRAIVLDNINISGEGFNPFECITLLDEFHKLFQLIDQGNRGFVTKDELQDYQTQIAKRKNLSEFSVNILRRGCQAHFKRQDLTCEHLLDSNN